MDFRYAPRENSMAISQSRARTGSRRRRRHTRARQPVAGKSHPLLWIAVSALAATLILAPAYAGPESCEIDGTTAALYVDGNDNQIVDAHDKLFELGQSGDLPVAGDFNGDGVDEIAVLREMPSG